MRAMTLRTRLRALEPRSKAPGGSDRPAFGKPSGESGSRRPEHVIAASRRHPAAGVRSSDGRPRYQRMTASDLTTERSDPGWFASPWIRPGTVLDRLASSCRLGVNRHGQVPTSTRRRPRARRRSQPGCPTARRSRPASSGPCWSLGRIRRNAPADAGRFDGVRSATTS